MHKLHRWTACSLLAIGVPLWITAEPQGVNSPAQIGIPSKRTDPPPAVPAEMPKRVVTPLDSGDILPDGKATHVNVPTVDFGNGITVGVMQVYDDRALQSLLDTARARLATLQVIEQSGLLQRLGSLQGASLQQSQLGVNLLGLPKPSVDTVRNTGGTDTERTDNQTDNTVTTTEGDTTTTVATTGKPTKLTETITGATGSTTIKQPSFTPAVPALPNTTGFALPSGFTPSASDLLSEMVQLQAEIANYQMLLEGSLSSHYYYRTENGKSVPYVRRRTTVGFPVWVNPSDKYRDAVAEIVVDIMNDCGQGDARPPAELISVLPREKTYNVAALTDRTTSLGSAVVVGAMSGGFNLLTGRKTFYVVKDQDTLGLQFPVPTYIPVKTPTLRFGWQFRPVLGKRVVSSVPRQVFAQIAFDVPAGLKDLGRAHVSTRWKRYNARLGTVSSREIRKSLDLAGGAVLIPNFPLKPRLQTNVEDLGDGNVLVRITPYPADTDFFPGTFVRFGTEVIQPGTAGSSFHPRLITLAVPALSLVKYRMRLVARNGEEADVLADGKTAVKRSSTACIALPENNGAQIQCIEVLAPTTKPKDATTTTVTARIRYEANCPYRDSPVVVIGDRISGLRNSPYVFDTFNRDTNIRTLELDVPNETLRRSVDIAVSHLLGGEPYTGRLPYKWSVPFSIDKLTVVSQGAAESTYALQGRGLTGLQLTNPAKGKLAVLSDEFATMAIATADLRGLKQVIFSRPTKPVTYLLQSIPPFEEKKRALTDTPAIKAGTKKLEVSGVAITGLNKVTFRGQDVATEKPTAEKPWITIALPPEIVNNSGTYDLDFSFKEPDERLTLKVVVYDTKVSATPR